MKPTADVAVTVDQSSEKLMEKLFGYPEFAYCQRFSRGQSDGLQKFVKILIPDLNMIAEDLVSAYLPADFILYARLLFYGFKKSEVSRGDIYMPAIGRKIPVTGYQTYQIPEITVA